MLLAGEGEAACVYPGEECAVRAAVRTAERCRNGASEPAGDLCECINGGAGRSMFRPVSDPRGTNSQRKPGSEMLVNLEQQFAMFAGLKAFCTLNMLGNVNVRWIKPRRRCSRLSRRRDY